MPTVLVVDDEPAIRESLERALALESYAVAIAADGEAALTRLAESPVDAVVLDLAMPGIDGIEVCRRLRRAGDRTPLLILTARDAVADRVDGLDAGADDYLVKPFALAELKARLRALLRRREPGDSPVIRFADLTLDPATREVTRGDRRSTSRAPSSRCSSCSWSTRAKCSAARRSTRRSGASTSGRARTRSASTSATCAARRRARARRA